MLKKKKLRKRKRGGEKRREKENRKGKRRNLLSKTSRLVQKGKPGQERQKKGKTEKKR